MLRKFRFSRFSPLLPAFNWYKLNGGGGKGDSLNRAVSPCQAALSPIPLIEKAAL